MTAIDDARAALHAAQEHIGHATTILYACHQGAGQIIQQATQLGASGVANNVAGLRKQIETVHHDLAVIDGQANKARQLLDGLDAHATPADIAAALAAAYEQTNEMIKHAGHAASQVDRLIATTHAVLRGGRPEPMVAKLTDAKTHLETVAQQSQIAGDKAQQTQGAVTVLGNF